MKIFLSKLTVFSKWFLYLILFNSFILAFNLILNEKVWNFTDFSSTSEMLFVVFFTPGFLWIVGYMGFFLFFEFSAVAFFIIFQIFSIIFVPLLFTKNVREFMRGFVAFGWILMWFSMALSTHQSDVLLWNPYDREYQNADAAGFPLEAFYFPLCYTCGHDIPPLSEYYVWVPFFLNCMIWICASVFVGYFVVERYKNIKHSLFVIILSFAVSFLCFGHLLIMYD